MNLVNLLSLLLAYFCNSCYSKNELTRTCCLVGKSCSIECSKEWLVSDLILTFNNQEDPDVSKCAGKNFDTNSFQSQFCSHNSSSRIKLSSNCGTSSSCDFSLNIADESCNTWHKKHNIGYIVEASCTRSISDKTLSRNWQLAASTRRPTSQPSASPSCDSNDCSLCSPGEYKSPISSTCEPCPLGKYSKEANRASSCDVCGYPFTTPKIGSNHCTAISLGFTNFYLIAILLGILFLTLLAVLQAGRNAMVSFLIMAFPWLDVLTDLAYILTTNFQNYYLFAASVFVFIVPNYHFVHLIAQREIMPFFLIPFPLYCCHDSVFWLSSDHGVPLVRNNKLYISFDKHDSLFKVFYYYVLWLVLFVFQFICLLFFVLWSIIHIPFWIFWLHVGMLLYQTKVIAIGSVWSAWCLLWTGTRKFSRPEHEVDLLILNECLFIEFAFESLPQIIIQSINNTLLNSWNNIELASCIMSAVSAVDGVYRYGYYCLWLGQAIQKVPIEMSIGCYTFKIENTTEPTKAKGNHEAVKLDEIVIDGKHGEDSDEDDEGSEEDDEESATAGNSSNENKFRFSEPNFRFSMRSLESCDFSNSNRSIDGNNTAVGGGAGGTTSNIGANTKQPVQNPEIAAWELLCTFSQDMAMIKFLLSIGVESPAALLHCSVTQRNTILNRINDVKIRAKVDELFKLFSASFDTLPCEVLAWNLMKNYYETNGIDGVRLERCLNLLNITSSQSLLQCDKEQLYTFLECIKNEKVRVQLFSYFDTFANSYPEVIAWRLLDELCSNEIKSRYLIEYITEIAVFSPQHLINCNEEQLYGILERIDDIDIKRIVSKYFKLLSERKPEVMAWKLLCNFRKDATMQLFLIDLGIENPDMLRNVDDVKLSLILSSIEHSDVEEKLRYYMNCFRKQK